MWIDYFDNNFFIKSLYPDGIPLENIKIDNFNVSDECGRPSVVFVFNIPKIIPKKWKDKNCNLVFIDLVFYEIKDEVICSINYNHNIFSNIEFEKESDFLKMTVSGRFNISLKCRFPTISSVTGVYDPTIISDPD